MRGRCQDAKHGRGGESSFLARRVRLGEGEGWWAEHALLQPGFLRVWPPRLRPLSGCMHKHQLRKKTGRKTRPTHTASRPCSPIGENLLVHYADAYNSTRTHLQLALSARLGRAGSRVYFPSADAVRVYNLYSGQLLQELKGHFGDVHCATASSGDVKVFSGGGDCAILTWTPPPCGLTAPAPPEECEAAGAPFDTTNAASQVRYADLGTGSIVDFIEAPSSLAGGAVAPRGGAAGAGARAVAEDGDAWSDDDEPPPPTRRAPVKRRRRGG